MSIIVPNGFKSIDPKNGLNDNMIKTIGSEWMLISARRPSSDEYNMMTASWGNVGFLWNKPVFTCYVRPQRYTFEFTENTDTIALSFFGDSCRDALKFCGSKSGRDCDKAAECGLTPRFDIDGAVYFDEARMVIVGRKLYTDMLRDKAFVDRSIVPACYAAGDFHKLYICEMTGVFIKE
nr:flavin reductase [Clostridia bacterium]